MAHKSSVSKTDIIENVHDTLLRKIINSRKSTPMYILYRELGRNSISVVIYSRMIAYCNRLLLSTDKKIRSNLKIYDKPKQ